MKDFIWRLPATAVLWISAICGGLLLHRFDPMPKIMFWFGLAIVAISSAGLAFGTLYLLRKIKMRLEN